MYDYTFRRPVDVLKIIRLNSQYDVPKYGWLRWILKLLRLSKPLDYIQPGTTCESFTVNGTSLLDVIRQFMTEVRRDGHKMPTKLYIGHDGYHKLVKDRGIIDQTIWPRRIYGMEIILTPYLDGKSFFPVFD